MGSLLRTLLPSGRQGEAGIREKVSSQGEAWVHCMMEGCGMADGPVLPWKSDLRVKESLVFIFPRLQGM